jgi:hypothetical protein
MYIFSVGVSSWAIPAICGIMGGTAQAMAIEAVTMTVTAVNELNVVKYPQDFYKWNSKKVSYCYKILTVNC